MSDIARRVEQLKSPKKDLRYEACEELRIAEALPLDALSALEEATNDQDASVADAARRALLRHRPLSPTPSPSSAAPPPSSDTKKPSRGCAVAVVIALLAGLLLLSRICSSGGGGDWSRWENCMATEEAFADDWGLTTNRAACERLKP